jgi:hypothetical protein
MQNTECRMQNGEANIHSVLCILHSALPAIPNPSIAGPYRPVR